MRRDDYVTKIGHLLDAYGIDYQFKHRGRHPAVVVMHDGHARTYFFPSSGSDWRGPERAVSDLRRMLGLRGAP
jgi:hypothetical protein